MSDVPVLGADGTAYDVRDRQTLWRCGRSGNKAFCDGSHWYAGFRDPVLEPVFRGMDPEHWRPVAAWLAETFGGPGRHTAAERGRERYAATDQPGPDEPASGRHPDAGLTDRSRRVRPVRCVRGVDKDPPSAGARGCRDPGLDDAETPEARLLLDHLERDHLERDHLGSEPLGAAVNDLARRPDQGQDGAMATQMRAVRIDGYGSVDVVEVREVDVPDPAPDRVVVEVVATSINPGEAMIREGTMDPERSATLPMGQGSDLAGRVVTVGAEVTGWAVGDEVVGWSDERSAHAQYVAVPADQLTRRPEEVPWEQAGSLYVAGGTAVAMRDAMAAGSGETVVVTAAAGGVGSILVQLLVRDGVRVLGVAGPDNDAWLRDVGVEPVNRGDDLAERLRTAAPDPVAAFGDCFGQGYTDLALDLGVAPERVVTIADFGSAPDNGARLVFGHESTTADTLAELAAAIAAGELTVPVAATYPLDRVREAYTDLAGRRTRGKIVLLP